MADPEIDAVIERIQTEGDVGKRNAQVKLPSITLLELTFFRVYSSRLSGIDSPPSVATSR